MCPSLQAELPRYFTLTIRSLDAEDREITPAQPFAPCFPPHILRQIFSLSSLKPEEDPLLFRSSHAWTFFVDAERPVGKESWQTFLQRWIKVFWMLSIYGLLKGFSTSLQRPMWYEMVLTAHAGHPSHFPAPQITCWVLCIFSTIPFSTLLRPV